MKRPRLLPAPSASLVVIASAAAVVLAGCRPAPEPEPAAPPPTVVENPALGLKLAPLDPAFAVEVNDGDQLVLRPADPAVGGRMVFRVRPPEDGQDLTFELKAHRVSIEGREGGTYAGGQELISQLGTTFYSRGRYLEDGREIEEAVVLALHPDADRMMSITYRYPAGVDSSIRVQQLIDVLSTVAGTKG